MSKAKAVFLFLIKSEDVVKSVRVIKTRVTLAKYLKQHPENEVKTFTSEVEALQYAENNNYPMSLQKLEVFAQVEKAREALSQGADIMKHFRDGIIDETSEAFVTLQKDEGLQSFIKQSSTLYNNYRQTDSVVESAAKKIIKENFYHLFFDGACKGNPGPSGVGFLILDKDAKVYEASINTGFKTNNQAEYLGLLYGLRASLNLGIQFLNVYGDSQLVINQMNNTYRVKDRNILLYNAECKKLRYLFKHVNFKHILRKYNHEADALSNKGVVASIKREEAHLDTNPDETIV